MVLKLDGGRCVGTNFRLDFISHVLLCPNKQLFAIGNRMLWFHLMCADAIGVTA